MSTETMNDDAWDSDPDVDPFVPSMSNTDRDLVGRVFAFIGDLDNLEIVTEPPATPLADAGTVTAAGERARAASPAATTQETGT